ncbi:MAG TPA: PIN domain-containing protein [Luteolibacter sp.]|nr:PIN domain-containing protein [Luteolibacter sp.]
MIDTNVILDIVIDDSTWAQRADEALRKHRGNGVFINPVIYAELCTGAPTQDYVDEAMEDLKLDYREIPRPGLFIASKAYKIYRANGGNKTSPLPDFFIGAHAQFLGCPIITRDLKRYRTYFPTVELITP